jgi:amino acid transporter
MEEASKSPRVVGKLGATLMSVNGMIGAGILISARLSNMFRSSGGPQLWAQVAFGPFVGFQVGWVLVLSMAAGRAATL